MEKYLNILFSKEHLFHPLSYDAGRSCLDQSKSIVLLSILIAFFGTVPVALLFFYASSGYFKMKAFEEDEVIIITDPKK